MLIVVSIARRSNSPFPAGAKSWGMERDTGHARDKPT